jgi:hypothetical protein
MLIRRLFVMLLMFLGALAAQAQSTNTAQAGLSVSSASAGQFLKLETSNPALPSINFRELKPNELQRGKILYSGIAVEAAKKRRGLQLFNPKAPPEYGSAEDNVARDPINGRVTGLKIFAIRF